MKVNVGRMKKSDRDKLHRDISKQINSQMAQVIKDREMMAGCRAQWMLLVADYRRYGHGKKRLEGTIEEVGTMLESLYADREAEVMDETLILDLERIGFDVRKNFAEYFECAERLKNFGKFIDKEKEAAIARKKRKRASEEAQHKY